MVVWMIVRLPYMHELRSRPQYCEAGDVVVRGKYIKSPWYCRATQIGYFNIRCECTMKSGIHTKLISMPP